MLWNQVLNAAQAEILQNKFTVFHVVRNWKEDTKTQHEIQLSNIFLHTGRVYITQTTHCKNSVPARGGISLWLDGLLGKKNIIPESSKILVLLSTFLWNIALNVQLNVPRSLWIDNLWLFFQLRMFHFLKQMPKYTENYLSKIKHAYLIHNKHQE